MITKYPTPSRDKKFFDDTFDDLINAGIEPEALVNNTLFQYALVLHFNGLIAPPELSRMASVLVVRQVKNH